MTEIINGELVLNELSKNSNGGTELMARRMVNSIDKELLSKFNIIHSRVRNLSNDKPNILVLHDLPNDPESAKLSDPEYRKQFAKFVFVSNWQLQYYNLSHGVPYSQSVVIKNAIEPIDMTGEKSYNGVVKMIYHTTPHRGLEILYPAFDAISQKCTELGFDVHLDVYSSFAAYGWESRDEPYKELFDKCKDHEKITYHGFKSNDIIREALKETHIFAYPSIWPETSCLAAIEALNAKNLVVCPNYAALPETTAEWAMMYQFDEDLNKHANVFTNSLFNAAYTIHANGQGQVDIANLLDSQKQYYDNFYSWETRKHEWEHLLHNILEEQNV